MSFPPSTRRWPSSALSGATKDLSMTTKTHNGMTKRFVFGSEWNFMPEGRKSVNQRFEEELEANNLTATIEWHGEDHTFRITCPHTIGEGVWKVVFKVIQELIDQESGDGWEDSDEDSSSGVDDQDVGIEKPSNKIQHISALRMILDVPEITSEDGDDHASDSYQPMLGINFPDKVRFYKAKTIWECQATNPSLDEIVPDELLLKLGRLIEGDFVKDLNQDRIYIGASCEEECRRAVCKLDNIRKNWDFRYPYVKHLFYTEELEKYEVLFKHIIDIKKKFFETTLLDNLQLSRVRFDYFNLGNAVTVRCAAFNTVKSRFTPFKVGKYTAAIDLDNKDSGPREWKDFKYAAYTARGQDEHNNTMTRFERYSQRAISQTENSQQPQKPEQSNAQDKDVEDPEEQTRPVQNTFERIQLWKDNVPGQGSQSSGGSYGNIQSDHRTSNNQRENPSWDIYQPYTEERAKSKKKHPLIQNPGLQAAVSTIFRRATLNIAPPPRQSLSEQVPQQNKHQSFAPAAFNPPSQKLPPKLDQASSRVQLSENVPHQQTPRNHAPPGFKASTQDQLPDFLQESPVSARTSNSPQPSPVKRDTEVLIHVVGLEPTLVVATDENIAHFNFAEFPVLKPARNGPASSLPSPNDLLGEDPFSANPHFFQSYYVPEAEALQRVNEVATRRFYSTMNQKAPKTNLPRNTSNQKASRSHLYATRLEAPSLPCARGPSPSTAAQVIDPTPEFIADINKSFYELLQGLRGFQGETAVQAEFGRILMKRIPRKAIALGNSEASFGHTAALELLENANGLPPIAIFSKILTAIPADISYLLEMKDCQEQSLWSHNQCDCSIFYEILCVDGRSGRLQPFTIEIDGETLEARAKTRRDFGGINVHGIKRHWDFRISATGIEATENVDPAHTEFAEEVKKTLHIPNGLRNPMLFFELPDAFAHFVIHGVRVRRVSRYPSLDTKSILNVSEVRELQMEEAAGDNRMIYKWFGSLDPSVWLAAFGYQHLFLWHEVSISCPKADEIFELNKTLELGEEASWTAERLSTVDAVSSLYLPACEMVKHMDGVGFYNDNGMSVQTVPCSSFAETVTGPPYYFW